MVARRYWSDSDVSGELNLIEWPDSDQGFKSLELAEGHGSGGYELVRCVPSRHKFLAAPVTLEDNWCQTARVTYTEAVECKSPSSTIPLTDGSLRLP